MNATWADAAAVAIGERILSEAVIDGGCATWWLPQPVRGSKPPRNVPKLANGSLYGGTAGIALFLSELGRVTGRSDFVELGRMGLRHAMVDPTATQGAAPSLHAGAVGFVFAAAAYLRHTDDAELREYADKMLRMLANNAAADDRLDIIGGCAGAIVGLLTVNDIFDRGRIEDVCTSLGEDLVARAQVEPQGISWRSGSTRRANLCGLAHGAAGIGWALLELHARTGRSVFRVAGEEAFNYEGRWFNAERGNWADLRNSRLYEYESEGRLHELRAVAEVGGALPLYEEHFMTAWCHGAAGIGMTRARAHALLGSPRYRREALAALPATIDSLAGSGHSLCHGFTGNAEALLVIARTLNLPELEHRTIAQVEAVTIGMNASGRRWRSGRPGHEPDLCLMTGEAGIGLFLLGLSRRVVSATFPTLRHPVAVPTKQDDRPLRRRIALECFPHVAEALGSEHLETVVAENENTSVPVVDTLVHRLDYIATTDDAIRPMFWADTIALEQGRRSPFDHSLGTLASAIPALDWDRDPVMRAPWAEIVDGCEARWLLHPDLQGRWRMRQLNEMLAALLEVVETPCTADQATLRLAMTAQIESMSTALRTWVRAQIRELARARIVVSLSLARAINHEPVHQGAPLAQRIE